MSKRMIEGNIIVVLENVRTGKKRVFEADNLITNDGDVYYAKKGCGESPFTVAGVRLGTNAGTATAPAKADVKMQTTTGSTPNSTHTVDSTYPKTNDGDTDNTGAGTKVVTWRFSFLTSEGNAANIATIDLPDSLTDGSITKSLSVANFGAKFEKTSSDTLKIFINHAMLGV